VPRSDIDRIREKIRFRQYDMSAHAMEEMAEDFLTILDVEEAVFSGQVIRVEKEDPRGTKYTHILHQCINTITATTSGRA
jgi:hypothetical protein